MIQQNDTAVTKEPATRSTDYQWNRATRVLVSITVLACFLATPVIVHASIFTSLVSAVSSIGKVEARINGNQASMNNFNSSVVVPPNQLMSLQRWLTQVEGSYKGWFSSVLGVRVSSATLGASSSFENALHSGLSGGNGSAIPNTFVSVYGARPSGNSATTGLETSVDAADTEAQEGMVLAAKSDNASMQLISTANKLQSLAGSAAPGTADMTAAESQVLQLQSYAMQQHLLAAMLRQQATKLASEGSDLKTATANHSGVMQKLFGGMQ